MMIPQNVEVKFFNKKLIKKLNLYQEFQNKNNRSFYKTDGALAFDLYAIIEEPIVIYPHHSVKIPTGLALQMWSDDMEFGLLVAIRSSLSDHLALKNSLGIIDCIPINANIKTIDGYVKLEELIKNYKTIISYDIESEREEEDTINEIWKVGEKNTIKFEFDDNTSIEVTETQLVLTKYGWKQAIDLTLNDEIISS